MCKSRPFNCECGSIVRWDNKERHFKTKHHLKFINSTDKNKIEMDSVNVYL